jgi:TatD DNase family protein
MALVDTHCHLQDERFDPDREAVFRRSLESLDWLVLIGDDVSTSRKALDLTRDRVYAAVGVHPYHAAHFDAAALDTLREMAAHAQVRAIGEIGLDYYNEFSPRRDQAVAFRRQLQLACELKLPVVVHNREADEDAFAMLQEYTHQLPGCIMHCFGSDPAFAERCIEMGWYVSFAGNVTFPRAQLLREAAAIVPLDRLLIETDSPYLAPPPKRGERCEPGFVRYTAEVLAGVKNLPPGELADRTTENARRVYSIQ